MARLSDDQIHVFLVEEKPLPEAYGRAFGVGLKRGHSEAALTVKGVSGSEFVVILRKSQFNPLDFFGDSGV